MVSDFRIDPTIPAHLDYGENPDKSSRHQGTQTSEQEREQKPYLDHGARRETETSLKSRKAQKKRLEKKKKKRKLAERQARENSRDEQ